MAKIGLSYVRYCKITENDVNGVVTETLGPGKALGKAVKLTSTPKTTDAKLYADDGVAESVKEFAGGELAVEIDDLSDEVAADIHGATVDEDTGDVIDSATDVAPYMRLGGIIREVKNGVPRYRGRVYMKVQFRLPSEDAASKGENIEFKTISETADVMRNAAGVWRRSKAFPTLPEAITYVNSLTGAGA